MATIRVFEPALCCSTGVCGPDLDQNLVDFTANLTTLKAEGIDIERANLASEPTSFASHPAVRAFLQAAGSAGLPLTLVDDVTVLTGRHPQLAELRRWAGLTPADAATSVAAGVPEGRTELPQAGGCCGGAATTGCC